MRFSTSFLVLVFSLFFVVQGQTSIADLPACGLTCLLQTVPAAGCSFTDTACICNNKKLAQASANCLQTNCTMADTLTVSKIEASMCQRPDENIGHLLMIISLTMCSIAALCVALRFVTKVWIAGNVLGLDDYFLGVALINEGIIMWVTVTMILTGFGTHSYQLEHGDLLLILQKFWIATFLYVFNLGLIKLSVLFFYLRLFPHEQFRRFVWACMGFVVVSTLLIVFLSIFQCTPIPFYWNKDIEGKCLNLPAVAYSGAAVTIASDIFIVILPIPVIKSLNLGWKKKLGVMCMFALGSFGCIVSVIRLQSLVSYGDTVDPTFDLVWAVIWSALEVQTAMIAVCFPALRRLLARVLPKQFGTTGASASSSSSSKPRSAPKSWNAIGSFASPTAIPVANEGNKVEATRRDEEAAVELDERDVKTGQTFYIAESVKRSNSNESVEPLVELESQFNQTKPLPAEPPRDTRWRRESWSRNTSDGTL